MFSQVVRTIARPAVQRFSAPACRSLATYFVSSHEYIRVEGSVGTVGISAHAADALGDIVFCELPDVGSSFAKGETFGSVESVKAASDVYLPVAGEVTATNAELEGSPSLVNESPMEAGWFVKINIPKGTKFDDLMDEAAYKTYLETLAH